MRVAEVVGALSLAADVASGLAMEKGLRTVVVAVRLAERAGAGGAECDVVFWVTALRFVGCLGFASEETAFSAGDDNSLRRTLAAADFDQLPATVLRMVRGFAPEASLVERTAGIARFFLSRGVSRRYARAHCESGVFFARTLGMADDVARALDVTGERYDGRGVRGIGGDELPFAAGIADVADVLELFGWAGGVDHARQVATERRGRTLDPALVDTALLDLGGLLEGLDRGSAWDTYLAAEPTPLEATGEGIDRGCVALGRFGDLKSVYTLTHSQRVATFARTAGEVAGVDAAACALLYRAGSVHDLGRVAVPTGTWDKAGPLNPIEWQRVRSHSHHTDLVLRAAGLGEIADLSGAVHERGRGSGYHRGVPLDAMSGLAKIVAAADVMAALGEDRPHRPAFGLDAAVRELRAMVEAGALDPAAARWVLEVSGAAPERKRAWPAGLSDREVDVVRLVAVGRTCSCRTVTMRG